MIQNKIFKSLSSVIITVVAFIGLSCDDRVVTDSASVDALNLTILSAQPIANGASVGEAIVGYAGVLIVAELRDSDNNPYKNGLISFSAKVNGVAYGGFDINSVSTNSDGIAVVTFTASSGNGAVDDITTPLYENVQVTAYFNDKTDATTRFDVYGSKDEVWPYSVTMTDPSPEEITLAAGSSSEITCRLLNKNGKPVRNVIVQIDAGEKGYIKINDSVVDSDTTDNNGEVTFSFLDNGEQSDIGIASIEASFNHPTINQRST